MRGREVDKEGKKEGKEERTLGDRKGSRDEKR